MPDPDRPVDQPDDRAVAENLDARLRAVRPPTVADAGWVDTAAGRSAFAAIRAAATEPADDGPAGRAASRRSGRLVPLRRGATTTAALTAAAAAVVALVLALPHSSPRENAIPHRPAVPLRPASPAQLVLASYDTCAAALHDLREHAAAHPDAYQPSFNMVREPALPAPATRPSDAKAAPASVPDHSTTNNQESGVDEPDVVQTDGRHVYTLTDGVLRVTDVASHRVTSRLELSHHGYEEGASMLLSGHRLLIMLPGVENEPLPAVKPVPSGNRVTGSSSTYLLVDVSGAAKIVSTMRTRGNFVDARLVDGRVRLVVSDQITVDPLPLDPSRTSQQSDEQRAHRLAHAPLSTWQPTWTVTTGGRTSHGVVPCDQLKHPAHYTGATMLTVYTVDPSQGFGDVAPVTLAADGSTVYASASSLYVTSTDPSRTQLHRFDIAGTGRPRYVGSGTVPGFVRDAYSMSDYDGTLRVVSAPSPDASGQASAVYTLDDRTMRVRGHVAGLGRNERTYGVRFAGSLGFVVTFRSIDPLYVLDLSDPDRPRRVGTLTLEGVSQYLHATGSGRLLGVGTDADSRGVAKGTLVSLFDVGDPAHPSRLDHVTRAGAYPAAATDTHAFQYWEPTHTAFVPLTPGPMGGAGRVLVVRVNRDALHELGTIANPTTDGAGSGPVQWDPGISRTLVIGSSIWTLSPSGLQVSDGRSLAREAWIPFG